MLSPAIEEKLRTARMALDSATSDLVIDACKKYLAVLAEYRSELYRLPETLVLAPSPTPTTSDKVVETRKAVRIAIEHATQERRRVEELLLSFTAVSGYGAVETLNKKRYMDRDDWKLSAGGVGLTDETGHKRMTILEAVDVASLLRREAFIVRQSASLARE